MFLSKTLPLLIVLCCISFTASAKNPLFDIMLDKAKHGDVQSQVGAGVMYQFGEEIDKNYAEALSWYRLAADSGNGDALYFLGSMYQHGLGVRIDDHEAVGLYKLSVLTGNAHGQWALGKMYEAANMYRKAAIQGDSSAQTALGTLYYFG